MMPYAFSALRDAPIGLFDSGLGGTTVLSKLAKLLPHENILYFGDTARLPYGDKTPAQILEYSAAILKWMASQGVKMVLMGCNTSSALAYPYLNSLPAFNFPVFDIIRPFAKNLASGKKTIGVFATPASVKSDMHKKIIQHYHPNIDVLTVSCPEWVSIIENGEIEKAETAFQVKKYVEPILEQGAEALVYGCTHYPLLGHIFRQAIPDYLSHIEMIDPADFLIQKAIQYLSDHDLLRQNIESLGKTQFYVTGDTQLFSDNMQRIWGNRQHVEHASLLFTEKLKIV